MQNRGVAPAARRSRPTASTAVAPPAARRCGAPAPARAGHGAGAGARAAAPPAVAAAPKIDPRRARDLGGRPRRSERSALPGATRRCCRRTCAPTRAASSSRRRSACWSTRVRSPRTTTCCATSSCRRSGEFVTTVVRESAPRTGKDGLASLTTEAVVNVQGGAEVAQRDVAQRAHRVHSRERRSARRGAHRRRATPTRPMRRRSRRPPPRTS